MNRQQALLLERQLRVLSKQERVAEFTLNKTIREAERLRKLVGDQTRRGINLKEYDSRKTHHRGMNYGFGVKFPPLSTGHPLVTAYKRSRAVPLSRRALIQSMEEIQGDNDPQKSGAAKKATSKTSKEPLVVHLRDLRL